MTDKKELLTSFDNQKLIDIVKNYRQYGYDDTLRNTALSILKERGVDEDFLKMTGNFKNSAFDLAEDIYASFIRNSKIAFILYLISIAIPIFAIIAHLEYNVFIIVLRLICIVGFILFFIQSLVNQNQFHKSIGKEDGTGFVFVSVIFGMLFYVIMYFIAKKQMAEDMKLIK